MDYWPEERTQEIVTRTEFNASGVAGVPSFGATHIYDGAA